MILFPKKDTTIRFAESQDGLGAILMAKPRRVRVSGSQIAFLVDTVETNGGMVRIFAPVNNHNSLYDAELEWSNP